MNTRLALSVLSLISLGALTTPASAIKVKVPTAGDIDALQVPVVNLTDDYIVGGHFDATPTGVVFTSYRLDDSMFAPYVAPHSTGDVTFEFYGDQSSEQVTGFQLPLYEFAEYNVNASDPTNPGRPDPVYYDPDLEIDVVTKPDCAVNDTACLEKESDLIYPGTITIPAPQRVPPSVPEPASLVTFGLGVLGLSALVLRARKRRCG